VKVDSPTADARLERLLVCPNFNQHHWQLPLDGTDGRLLIGWRVASPSIDAGVPPQAVDLLMTTLCGRATLTFAAAIRAPLGTSFLSRTWRTNRHFTWSSTSDPKQAAAGVFSGEPFAWSLQAQVVVLSEPGVSPRLDERHLELLTKPQLFQGLASLGAIGALLPGVDGAVAALYTCTKEAMRDFEHALSLRTHEAGCEFVSVTEDAFARILAQPSTMPR
jgi:hypothetical protein